MPIFEYSCADCGLRFEKLHKPGIEQQCKCPGCGSARVRKELSPFSSVKAASSADGCASGGG
ncbi:MAG TPA: zinc ribbon domain-containing protein [Desulfuromonadaceae bacterium]